MKYMMLVCVDPAIEVSAEEAALMRPRTEAWVEEFDGRGVRQLGNRLVEPSNATTVRIRDGEVVIADGPFAETKEFVAGFDILECADLDEAIEAATKHPCATVGALEIRPFWEE